MTRNTTSVTVSVRNSKHTNRPKRSSILDRIKMAADIAVNILSMVAATIYALLYIVGFAAFCIVALALCLVVLDTAIIVLDPMSSWGAGNAYELFWFCVELLKWTALCVGAVAAFFGITYGIGVVFRDAYENAIEEGYRRSTVYLIFGVVFFLPTLIVKIFLDNAEEQFGSWNLLEVIAERIAG